MENIYNIENRSTRKNYLAYIKHFSTEDIDWRDIEKMKEVMFKFSMATAFNMSKALYIYSGRNKEIGDLLNDIREKYLGELITKKEKKGVEEIDWQEIVDRLYQGRRGGQEQMMMFIWSLLCAYHPRRFTDYRLIANVEKEGWNYFNKTTGVIHFKNFKNSKSKTKGEVEVALQPKVQKWLYAYCLKYKINGLLFECNDRRLQYLIDKYKIPRTTHNRKFQETRLLKDGMSPYEVSKKFNHSVGTQQLHYRHQ